MANNYVDRRQERIALRRQNRTVRWIVGIGIALCIGALVAPNFVHKFATPTEVKASIQKRPPHHTLNDG